MNSFSDELELDVLKSFVFSTGVVGLQKIIATKFNFKRNLSYI